MTTPAVGGLRARKWQRLERNARSAYNQETLSAARGLTGTFELITEPSPLGVLRLRDALRQVALAGVVLPVSLQGLRCHVVAVGRYGRWWWLRLGVGDRNVTVLGSHLWVAPVSGGGFLEEVLDSPAGGEKIVVPCEYGSPSATSPG